MHVQTQTVRQEAQAHAGAEKQPKGSRMGDDEDQPEVRAPSQEAALAQE